MSARDDYPDLTRWARGLVASKVADNAIDALNKIDQLRAEVTAAAEVLDRARRYAHACGLFTGGSEMDSYVAIVELLHVHDNCPDVDDDKTPSAPPERPGEQIHHIIRGGL